MKLGKKDQRRQGSFDRLCYRRHDASVFLYAFDLIELNGRDLRREPLERPKALLARLVRKPLPGIFQERAMSLSSSPAAHLRAPP